MCPHFASNNFGGLISRQHFQIRLPFCYLDQQAGIPPPLQQRWSASAWPGSAAGPAWCPPAPLPSSVKEDCSHSCANNQSSILQKWWQIRPVSNVIFRNIPRFSDADFSDPDFVPIRTEENSPDPDPDKRTRIRNTVKFHSQNCRLA